MMLASDTDNIPVKHGDIQVPPATPNFSTITTNLKRRDSKCGKKKSIKKPHAASPISLLHPNDEIL